MGRRAGGGGGGVGKGRGGVVRDHARTRGRGGGGSVAWNAEGTGVYYTRYPRKGERAEEDLDFYQQVYFHELGKPVAEDRYELGKELPRIAEIELNSSRDGKYV